MMNYTSIKFDDCIQGSMKDSMCNHAVCTLYFLRLVHFPN